FGWLGRHFRKRAEYENEKARLEQAIEVIEKERRELGAVYDWTRELFTLVACRVLAPLAVRARVVEAMRLHIEAHAIEFDTYVSAVQVQLAAASTDLDNQPAVREPVRQNVATP